MCIAILNSAEKITKSHFSNSLINNPDGFGMAYLEGGKIQVYKSLSIDSKKLYSEYSKVYDRTESPIILHFRIATSGGVNLSNTHPFHINKGLVFAHNGIIQGYGTKTENDTRHFAREILGQIDETLLFHNSAIQTLIEDNIGYSKLIFLNKLGETKIYGETLGKWVNGNWFSNDTYACTYNYKNYTPTKYNAGYQKINAKTWFDENEESESQCESCLELTSKRTYIQDVNSFVCDDCKKWFVNEKKYKVS